MEIMGQEIDNLDDPDQFTQDFPGSQMGVTAMSDAL